MYSAAVSCMQGRFLGWRFTVHCKMNKKTISNSRRRILFFYSFFFFFCILKCRRPMIESTRCRTGSSAYPAPSTWPSKAQSISASACVHLPPSRLGNDSEHVLEIWLCSHCTSRWLLFLFPTADHTPNPPPPLAIWKFFPLPTMCKSLRWPLWTNMSPMHSAAILSPPIPTPHTEGAIIGKTRIWNRQKPLWNPQPEHQHHSKSYSETKAIPKTGELEAIVDLSFRHL